ncbi:MAG: hypothetical protein AB8B56_07635 [Crocinitomicaceae bacterium]
MKRKSTIGIALLSVLFFAVSCKKEASSNIDQNRIYTDYEIVYHESANQTRAQAMFRLDNQSGKKIELTYPARVGFNDQNMAWKNVGGYYHSAYPGNGLNGSFTYFDFDENVYENTTVSIDPITLPFGFNSISTNGNFFLPWIGSSIQPGETVRVKISGGDQSGSEEFSTSIVGANYITLDQFKLNRLELGTALIEIEREYVSGIQQSTLAGGRITTRYEATRILVNIM